MSVLWSNIPQEGCAPEGVHWGLQRGILHRRLARGKPAAVSGTSPESLVSHVRQRAHARETLVPSELVMATHELSLLRNLANLS